MNRLPLVLALLLGACRPQLYLASAPPPARAARLDRADDVVELSEGVAVAVTCLREATPCADVRATTRDPEIARVLPAHLAGLHRGYLAEHATSALAIVGVRPGRTTLEVIASGSRTTYDVLVLAAPAAPPAPATPPAPGSP